MSLEKKSLISIYANLYLKVDRSTEDPSKVVVVTVIQSTVCSTVCIKYLLMIVKCKFVILSTV